MACIAVVVSVAVVIVFATLDVVNGNSKRLLLNDPDVLADRITKLENVIAQLQNDNQQIDSLAKQVQEQKSSLLSQTTQIQQLETTVAKLQHGQTNSGGSTFTIWGRTGCPNNNTELVYSGYVGGGIQSNAASSQDVLCITTKPIFGKTSTIPNTATGHMYGAEYDSDFFAPHANGKDMPCAVCSRKSVTRSLMIPGRNSCYSGWNVEYHGYLATEHYTHASGAKYICIAEQPEFLAGGEANTNAGKLFGPVVAKCGTLRCPPYHENYPLTCVVCSK